MALNCKITQGVLKECGFFPGGIKFIAFANLSDIAVVETNIGKGVIEADDISISTTSGMATGEKLFKVFEVADQTGTASSTVQVGGSRDAKSILQTVGGQIIGFGQDEDGNPLLLGDEYANFVLADVVALVKQNDGKVVLYGYSNGLKSDNFDYATGTAETDTNGITFQFSGTQYMSPIMIAGGNTAWETLTALAKQA